MVTRDEIKIIGVIEPYGFETSREEDWYQVGLLDGMEAADAEPDVTKLWHDITEEPEEASILYLTKNSNVGTIKNVTTHKWNWYIKKYSIKKWAYVDNIIPKI